jgi:hypothetical protein
MMAEKRDQNAEWDGDAKEQSEIDPMARFLYLHRKWSQTGASTALANRSQNLHPLEQHARDRGKGQPPTIAT